MRMVFVDSREMRGKATRACQYFAGVLGGKNEG